MNQVSIVGAKGTHAYRLRMRPCDLTEVMLWAPGVAPHDALCLSIQGSTKAWTLMDGAEVVAVYGYSVGGGVVHPWLISSEAIARHGRVVMRTARGLLEGLQRDYPGLLVCNYVHTHNGPAKAFLRALGFCITQSPGAAPEFDFFFLPPKEPQPCA